MRIHHLNCATMRPPGGQLLDGASGWLESGTIVAHCLLIDAGGTLVLVDTGLGVGDATEPKRIGLRIRAAARPDCRLDETAIRQVERLGYDPADVRHVILTHLDADHAGGIGDFPHATVHVHAPELATATAPPLRERWRYAPTHWAHRPRWAAHEWKRGHWFGFDSIPLLEELGIELLMVPLAGHSRGLAGVAVNTGTGWLFHCGDAFFHHDELSTPPQCPPLLQMAQTVMAQHDRARRRNQERLRRLARESGDQLRFVCSHDPALLAGAASASAAEASLRGGDLSLR